MEQRRRVKDSPENDDSVGLEVFGASQSKPAPEETTSTDDSLFLVSEDLVRQENLVHEQNVKRQEEEERSAAADSSGMTKQERYKKLIELLDKSNFYSQYLMDKMNADSAANLKKGKIDDRKKIKTQNKQQPRGNNKRKPLTGASEDQAATKKQRLNVPRTFQGEDIPDEQPLLLTGGVMRDYQIKGYNWMATLYEHGINGILGDEMGLGKTIQTIALFCHLIEMGVPGPYLIVAPLSTVPNWVNEFKRFAPLLPVVLYHGSQAERAELRRKKLYEVHEIEGVTEKARNVFVTSYEIAMNDRAHFQRLRWRFIVVDEGHRLKNTNCRLIKELKMYGSANRLLLTGTPLQNNLAELWSLLNFLMPEIFDNLQVFESWFDAKNLDQDEGEESRIILQEQQNNILSTLHKILTPFLLRRVKVDVDLKIPPKKEVLVYCPMTRKQIDLYESIVNKTIMQLMKPTANGDGDEKPEVGENGRIKRKSVARIDYSVFLDPEGVSERNLEKYLSKLNTMQNASETKRSSAYDMSFLERSDSEVNTSIKNRLMQLRKATNHPYLIEYPLTEDGQFYRSDEDMITICGKLKVMDQMLEELMKRGHKILIFSQMTRMLDILGDYLSFKGHKFSRLDGNMHFEQRQDNIDRFSTDPELKIFLLSTRAGGLGLNLTAADTCIIYDSDWNPQQDLQAQDRCHRIGQTKPVMIYRLVTANTIDQAMVERAAAKRKLEKLVIHSKKFKSQDSESLKRSMDAVTPQELLELLHSKDHAGVVSRIDGQVFLKEELDLLLDRRDLTWERQRQIQSEKANPVKSSKAGKKGTTTIQSFFKVIDSDVAAGADLQSVTED